MDQDTDEVYVYMNLVLSGAKNKQHIFFIKKSLIQV